MSINDFLFLQQCKANAYLIMTNCLDCDKSPSFNFPEFMKKPVYCKTHKKEGMINVINRRCAEPNCPKMSPGLPTVDFKPLISLIS